MLGFLLSLLVGWPAILVTLILAILGLTRNRHPFSWFRSGLPNMSFPAILFFLVILLLFFVIASGA
jgi:hypothetical protein